MSATGKVLLVLNDASEAQALADRLRGAGIEAVTASDGIQGLALVSELKPDVVACSRTLPKMDGLAVCRLIKRNHKLKHVAVLVLLDEGDDSAVVSSLEVGANDYLFRPLHVAEFVAAVRSHLKNRTSITRLKDDNKELATILEIAEMLSSTLSSADLFYIIVHKVAEALAVEHCSLLRVDPTHRSVTIEASMNPDDADAPSVPLAELPEVRRCIDSGKMVYVEDVRRDSELSAIHGGDEALSLLAVPLQVRQIEGRVVFRMGRTGDPFTYREIKFCQIATTVAGNALENAYLYESLEIAHGTLTEISKKDPLTDVLNRRALFERLDVEYSRAARKSLPLACLLLDVDHFKRINDELGHQTGDAVLIGLGRILKDCLRGQDVVGRYGGEEFLAVLPETDREGALMVAERIRREVRRAEFDGMGDRRVTISIGVALKGPDTAAVGGPHALVGRADEALYEAKHTGRDRVVAREMNTSDSPAAVSSKD